jgi:hypothetical protein
MNPQISRASLEDVRVPVRANAAGALIDPTGSTVSMAFIRGAGVPAGGDLKTASWDTDATTVPPTYRAQCLVGPGGAVELAAGTYRVWVRVADSPETPLKPAGHITVV